MSLPSMTLEELEALRAEQDKEYLEIKKLKSQILEFSEASKNPSLSREERNQNKKWGQARLPSYTRWVADHRARVAARMEQERLLNTKGESTEIEVQPPSISDEDKANRTTTTLSSHARTIHASNITSEMLPDDLPSNSTDTSPNLTYPTPLPVLDPPNTLSNPSPATDAANSLVSLKLQRKAPSTAHPTISTAPNYPSTHTPSPKTAKTPTSTTSQHPQALSTNRQVSAAPSALSPANSPSRSAVKTPTSATSANREHPIAPPIAHRVTASPSSRLSAKIPTPKAVNVPTPAKSTGDLVRQHEPGSQEDAAIHPEPNPFLERATLGGSLIQPPERNAGSCTLDFASPPTQGPLNSPLTAKHAPHPPSKSSSLVAEETPRPPPSFRTSGLLQPAPSDPSLAVAHGSKPTPSTQLTPGTPTPPAALHSNTGTIAKKLVVETDDLVHEENFRGAYRAYVNAIYGRYLSEKAVNKLNDAPLGLDEDGQELAMAVRARAFAEYSLESRRERHIQKLLERRAERSNFKDQIRYRRALMLGSQLQTELEDESSDSDLESLLRITPQKHKQVKKLKSPVQKVEVAEEVEAAEDQAEVEGGEASEIGDSNASNEEYAASDGSQRSAKRRRVEAAGNKGGRVLRSHTTKGKGKASSGHK